MNISTRKMELLPPEILEQIFAHVPLLDLFSVHSLVCKKWRDVISRENFMPWKKAYFRYKITSPCLTNKKSTTTDELISKKPRLEEKGEEPAEELDPKIAAIYTNFTSDLFSNGFINQTQHLYPPWSNEEEGKGGIRLEMALPQLAKFICKEFSNQGRTFELIKGHSKFALIQDWILERMPQLQLNIDLASLPLICGIFNSAWDVNEIFASLLRTSIKSCSALVVSEVMYAICLSFLVLSREASLPDKFHYNVFHGISFFENEFKLGICAEVKKTVKGQNTLQNLGFTREQSKMQLTAEQSRIANHQLQQGQVIKIVAFAGTGKTTTLIQMCQRHANKKFLVVMYNKSVQKRAEEIFPRLNCICVTAHSLAYRAVGVHYRHKSSGNLKAKDIIDSDLLTCEDALPERERQHIYQKAGQVLKTVESFMNSSDAEMDIEHVPSSWQTTPDAMGSRNTYPLTALQRQSVLENAQKVWIAMKDKSNRRIRMTHDGYLKLWQLTNPDLQDSYPHDVLMIDEGQDMNPAMLAVFNAQNTTKIIVGDPNQQIYLFRGAVNALGSVEASHTYHLTQSFRFGPKIGFLANTCLRKVQKMSNSQTLIGGKKEDFFINFRDLHDNIPKYKPIAVIARTNMGLFDQVVEIICGENSPGSACFAGGIESYNLDDLLTLYYLYINDFDKMKKWKGFRSFAAFKSFAQNTGDNELMGKLKIVESYKERIPELIAKIKQNCRANPKFADYVFSTTHKSKGLEWKTVILLDDFIDLENDFSGNHDDEKNLLYVALTRAKQFIVLNKNLIHLAILGGEVFEDVVGLKGVKSEEKCKKCHDSLAFEDNVLGLKSRMVRLKVGYSIMDSGFTCSVCAALVLFRDVISHNAFFRKKRVRSREFLRYVVGVLPEKFEEAKEKATQNFQFLMENQVANALQVAFNGMEEAIWFDSDEDDEDIN